VLRPTGANARVVGTFADGSAALVHNRRAEGQTLMIGSFAGMAHETQPSPGFARFVDQVLDWAGIRPPLEVRTEGAALEGRLMESSAGRLVIVFNRGDSAREVRVVYPAPAAARADAWTAETPVRAGTRERELRVSIPAHRVAAVFLSGSP